MYVAPLKYANSKRLGKLVARKKKKTCSFFFYRGELFIAKVALIPK